MNVHAYAVCGVLGAACLIFDVLALAGAAKQYPQIAAQARRESPLAHSYIVAGRYTRRWVPGAANASITLANASFGAAWPAVTSNGEVALDATFSHARGSLAVIAKAAYWLAFPLLLLALLLWWRRPKAVHLMGRR